MGSVPDERAILSAVRPLVDAGVAIHWLHRRKKRPIGDDWQSKPRHTLDSLTAAYQSGANVGIRLGEISQTAHGYLHLIDLDIRDAEQADDAWNALLEMWPDARSAPFVISGSGGESRHIYFFTDKPFRSRKIAKSKGFSLVWDGFKERDVKKFDWEIEVFGGPKQAVLPPSVHPDTGENYRWGREIDFDLLEMGVGAILSSDQVAKWGVTEDNLTSEDDDDLFALARTAPMGLSDAEIDETIRDLPEDWCDDRDMWLQVGAALHHEHQGGAPGFERWCEWSKASPKYDVQDQKRVWKSFKGARNPVRMATLIKAAAQNRLAMEHGEGVDTVDPLADLDDLPPLRVNGTALAIIPNDLADLLGAAPAIDDLADLLGEPSIAPGAARAKDLGVFDKDWRSLLQYDKEGKAIKPGLHNVEIILRHDPRFRGVMGFNEFTQEVCQIGRPGVFTLKKKSPKPVRQLDSAVWTLRDKINGDLWSDTRDAEIRLILETPVRQGGYSLKTTKQDLREAIDTVAQLNRFHPVRDYLNAQKWDGVPRLSRLFVDYLGSEDNAYHREAAQMFMLGAVTRIFEPGHKFDFVPILEGFQGKGKSTFISILARHWFAELEGDFHDTKGMVEKMQGSWLIEIPELQGFGKAEITTIKGFITRTTDKVRLAYARRAAEFPRQCIFMGSTNDHEYLRDSTGGRRFWPVACAVAEIDTDRLRGDVDQLWAEAVAAYRRWRLEHPGTTLPLYMKNPVAADEAKRLQESRRQQGSDDVLASRIEEWLDQPIGSDLGLDDLDGEAPTYRNEVCLLEIWEQMMEQDVNKYPDRDQQLLARAMRKLEGWEPAGRPRIPRYGRQRLFKRSTPK